MLAQVVVFENVHGQTGIGRSKQNTAKCHASNVFEDIGVLYGFGNRSSPGEGGVAGHEHTGHGDGVQIIRAEETDDDGTSITDIGLDGYLPAVSGAVTGTGP